MDLSFSQLINFYAQNYWFYICFFVILLILNKQFFLFNIGSMIAETGLSPINGVFSSGIDYYGTVHLVHLCGYSSSSLRVVAVTVEQLLAGSIVTTSLNWV